MPLIRSRLVAAALAAAACSGTAAAVPAAARPAAQAPQRLAIPFNPPLGRRLVYRLVDESSRNGRPHRTEVIFHIQFRRDGEGYVMRSVLQLPPGVPPPPAGGGLAQVLTQPTDFRVAATGEIVDIVGLEALWAASEAALGEALRTRPLPPEGQRALQQWIDEMRALPREDQVEFFSRNIAPIVALAGTEFRVGERIADRTRARSVFGSVDQEVAVRLVAVDDRTARFAGTSSVPNEQVEAMAREAMERFAAARRGPTAFRVLSNETRESYEVSVETGLTRRFVQERVLESETDGVREETRAARTLELVEP